MSTALYFCQPGNEALIDKLTYSTPFPARHTTSARLIKGTLGQRLLMLKSDSYAVDQQGAGWKGPFFILSTEPMIFESSHRLMASDGTSWDI